MPNAGDAIVDVLVGAIVRLIVLAATAELLNGIKAYSDGVTDPPTHSDAT